MPKRIRKPSSDPNVAAYDVVAKLTGTAPTKKKPAPRKRKPAKPR